MLQSILKVYFFHVSDQYKIQNLIFEAMVSTFQCKKWFNMHFTSVQMLATFSFYVMRNNEEKSRKKNTFVVLTKKKDFLSETFNSLKLLMFFT